jgi:hypothetical protein
MSNQAGQLADHMDNHTLVIFLVMCSPHTWFILLHTASTEHLLKKFHFLNVFIYFKNCSDSACSYQLLHHECMSIQSSTISNRDFESSLWLGVVYPCRNMEIVGLKFDFRNVKWHGASTYNLAIISAGQGVWQCEDSWMWTHVSF